MKKLVIWSDNAKFAIWYHLKIEIHITIYFRLYRTFQYLSLTEKNNQCKVCLGNSRLR